jgi:hypothetical protein
MTAAELCRRLTLEEKLDLLTGPSGFREGLLELFETRFDLYISI